MSLYYKRQKKQLYNKKFFDVILAVLQKLHYQHLFYRDNHYYWHYNNTITTVLML